MECKRERERDRERERKREREFVFMQRIIKVHVYVVNDTTSLITLKIFVTEETRIDAMPSRLLYVYRLEVQTAKSLAKQFNERTSFFSLTLTHFVYYRYKSHGYPI